MATNDFPPGSPLAALNEIDGAAQALELRVQALCKSAQLALLSRDPDAQKSVYMTLSIIMEAVMLHADNVNLEAETHGANWIDHGAERAAWSELGASRVQHVSGVVHA